MPTGIDNYSETTMLSSQVTSLMRRINALEASVSVSGGISFSGKWGVSGTGNGEFDTPLYIAHYNSELYVADSKNSRIQVFNLSGVYQRQWATTGEPRAVAEYSGEIYVTESDGNVRVYNTSGTLSRSWGVSATSFGVFSDSAEIYVSESGTPTDVEVFNTSGVSQRTIGSFGSGDGQLNNPAQISVYGGELYVADIGNDRVEVFTTSGSYQRKFGSTGTGDGEFQIPSGLAIDSSGLLYVSDRAVNRIQIFTTSGSYIDQIGSSGTGNGEFLGASGIAIVGSTLYIAEDTGDRIQYFSIGSSYTQTEFFSYTSAGTPTSLGTPNGGASIPGLTSLRENETNADLSRLHIIDMRTALTALAPNFNNPGTGNPYNWTNGSADNIYYVAMGDRSAYGATGGAQYTWTRTSAQMLGDFCYGIDIGEIFEIVTQLEAS